MDEGVALLALEPRLVRPGAIGDRLVVEEVLRLVGVSGDFHSSAFFVFFGLGVAASASTVGMWPRSVFPIRTLLRRIPSSRAFLILWRSLPCERPTLRE